MKLNQKQGHQKPPLAMIVLPVTFITSRWILNQYTSTTPLEDLGLLLLVLLFLLLLLCLLHDLFQPLTLGTAYLLPPVTYGARAVHQERSSSGDEGLP